MKSDFIKVWRILSPRERWQLSLVAGLQAFSGLIDWPLAAMFVVGGVAGSIGGTRLAEALGGNTGRLTTVFAGLIFIVALYMLWRSAAAFLPGMTI